MDNLLISKLKNKLKELQKENDFNRDIDDHLERIWLELTTDEKEIWKQMVLTFPIKALFHYLLEEEESPIDKCYSPPEINQLPSLIRFDEIDAISERRNQMLFKKFPISNID